MSMNYNLVLKRLDNQLPEFLTLADIKSYLRIDFQEDDELLRSLAIAVCEKAESFMAINLLERYAKQVVFDVASSEVLLYQTPVIKVEKVLDENNTIMPAESWVFNDRSNTVRFFREKRSAQISIEYVSGFTKNNIAQSIKCGLLEHISYLYDGKSISEGLPASSVDLYSAFRNRKIWR